MDDIKNATITIRVPKEFRTALRSQYAYGEISVLTRQFLESLLETKKVSLETPSK
jgi:hypothetical protein